MIGTLFLMLTAAAFGGYALSIGSMRPYQLLIPILLLEALFVMKWAAPLVPWKQVAIATAVVLAIHFVAEHVTPLLFVSEKIIEIVCVAGFGAMWVRRGYMPSAANRW